MEMARGWGRSEEDQAAEKEHARADQAGAATSDRPSRAALEEASRRRGIELSLARIEDELGKTESPVRRAALEAARSELRQRLSEMKSSS